MFTLLVNNVCMRNIFDSAYCNIELCDFHEKHKVRVEPFKVYFHIALASTLKSATWY